MIYMKSIVRDIEQLSKPSAIVSETEGLEIGKNLIDTAMVMPNAVGLSAVQLGIHKQVFVYKGSDGKLNGDKVWHIIINPEIVDISEEKMFFREGCLSLPGVEVTTHRPKQITYTDVRGENIVLTDTDAIVFQHEYDHLNGVLMTQRVAQSLPPESNVGKDKIGRNEMCTCGSKKKYKKCCGK